MGENELAKEVDRILDNLEYQVNDLVHNPCYEPVVMVQVSVSKVEPDVVHSRVYVAMRVKLEIGVKIHVKVGKLKRYVAFKRYKEGIHLLMSLDLPVL